MSTIMAIIICWTFKDDDVDGDDNDDGVDNDGDDDDGVDNGDDDDNIINWLYLIRMLILLPSPLTSHLIDQLPLKLLLSL